MVIRDRKKERRRSADIVVFPTDATLFFVVVGKIEIISLLCFIQRERNAPACSRAQSERMRKKSSSSSSFFARERERERERESESDARSTLSLSLSLSVCVCSEFLEKTLDLFFD